ncbi:MAG: MazG nucleotide pyrophosphohydrolase domain-containing protein [Planctomycetota bacterium]
MEISAFQDRIAATYLRKDTRRGLAWTYAWFVEEVGELGKALRESDGEGQAEEFADAFAWLCGLANLAGVRLEEAVARKYAAGCPVCRRIPCSCEEEPPER